MGRKASVITLTVEEREYLEAQTRARTIQAQTVNRARILLLKADGCSIDDIAVIMADYLNKRVFAGALSTTVMADESDIRGFERFLRLYRKALPVHQAAVAVTDKEV